MTKTYAVYRPLYGEDFIRESILSIINHVDKVFFCYSDVALAGVESAVYKGELIQLALRSNSTIDGALDIVREMQSEFPNKIVIMKQDGRDNMNQFTRIVNEMILPHYDKPDIVMCIEPDCVFDESVLGACLHDLATDARQNICVSTKQIEHWKTPEWVLPERQRTGVVFWKFKDEMPRTKRQAEPVDDVMERFSQYRVHNFGFCISADSMFTKHLLALAFSPLIGDSKPNPLWYEEKWLKWDPIKNNKDLEISIGYENMIPFARPYDKQNVPEIIRRKYYGDTA